MVLGMCFEGAGVVWVSVACVGGYASIAMSTVACRAWVGWVVHVGY
jgi:hypothetical protein